MDSEGLLRPTGRGERGVGSLEGALAFWGQVRAGLAPLWEAGAGLRAPEGPRAGLGADLRVESLELGNRLHWRDVMGACQP